MAHDFCHQDKFRVNAKPKISKLILTEKQRRQLNNLFALSDKEIFTTKIWGETIDDQKDAKDFLIYQGIPVDLDDPTTPINRDPLNRWKIRWSDKKNGATLYQCSCGSDMQAASKTPIQKQRPIRQLYEFNGCLAFLRLEIDVDKKLFTRAHGYLDHSEACHRALPKRDGPKISINIDVKDMTELLVRSGASTNEILSLNQQFIKDQLGGRLILRNKLKCIDEHFLITVFDIKDARRWIKSHPRPEWNINVDRSVYHNIQELFGPNSSDSDLKDATVYYKPRDHPHDYTFLILASEEQRSFAWKYGHLNYIILDGTFKTNNKKIQMYIIMVIDEYKRGIPVGYLIFSRPGNTDLIGTSNHEYGILKHLLEMYKDTLSRESGKLFSPKERYNEPPRKKLQVKILALYDGELEFIKYLLKDWVNELSHMWTFYGRRRATDILRTDVDSIPWTLSYLDGFKRQFNPKRILRFQRKGHVLRLDALAVMLVKVITPICNIQRELWNNIHDVLKTKKSPLEGLAEEEEFDEGTTRALLDTHINTIAFDDLDLRKKEAANFLKIKFIEFSGNYLYVKVQCDMKNPEYIPDNENMDYYVVCLAPFISCHCFNFLLRGGACSHIRAAINITNWMRQQPRDVSFFQNLEHWEMPFIQLDSRSEALKKLRRQRYKTIFRIKPNHPVESFSESDSDSEDENVDFFNPYVNIMSTRLDFGVGKRTVSNSTLVKGSLDSGTERDRVFQSWDNDLSFATNRLIANMNDLVTVFERLTQNETVLENAPEELKILDRELHTKLDTLIHCSKSRELVMTLWQMRQKLDSITGA
ncbi:hypothetical protein C1645_779242 [Glomus cerebriforme]|uniref:SWIM-type domain-containing protein n=1 Tax=Glomus cerebriforme TaxID=658196 RepID=A0A397SKA7_9GLOM|nr:hypothetical protein C1645_779242 [Glomus cerebriforme]